MTPGVVTGYPAPGVGGIVPCLLGGGTPACGALPCRRLSLVFHAVRMASLRASNWSQLCSRLSHLPGSGKQTHRVNFHPILYTDQDLVQY